MPAKSKAMFRFFKALENDPTLRKEKGVSEEAVKDYTKMSKGRWSKLKEKIGKK